MVILFSDRKKDLVKLQAGEYISLGKIETEFKTCPLVDNICVYAESSKQHIVALVVPNQKHLRELAFSFGVSGSHAEMCASPEVNKAVIKELTSFGLKRKHIKSMSKFRFVVKLSTFAPIEYSSFFIKVNYNDSRSQPPSHCAKKCGPLTRAYWQPPKSWSEKWFKNTTKKILNECIHKKTIWIKFTNTFISNPKILLANPVAHKISFSI